MEESSELVTVREVPTSFDVTSPMKEVNLINAPEMKVEIMAK